MSIIAVWERGLLEPARPDTRLSATSVPVVIGTDEQLTRLERQVTVESQEPRPALVIGGGRVGRAVIRALERKEVPVHLIELDPAKCQAIRAHCAKVFQGDASDYELLEAAGICEASSVVLTTNDDATNVYLSSYCRRLNEGLRVISRITRERNLEAIHRAGADFVLSFACLGSAAMFSILRDRHLVVMGEEADLFAWAGSEAIDLARELQPDVLITDLAMPEMSGLELTWTVRDADLPTRVLLFAAHYSDSYIVQAFDCGAAGYVLKGKADERLVDAIRMVADGEQVFSEGVVDRSLEAYVSDVRQARRDLFDTLTEREREILFLITQALETADIADRLSISSRTVEKHLEHMYGKLGFSGQLELMCYGFQQGFIPLPQVEPG